MKTIGLMGLIGLILVGCDDGADHKTAALKLRLAMDGEAKAKSELLKSQAEAKKLRVRISELEITRMKGSDSPVLTEPDQIAHTMLSSASQNFMSGSLIAKLAKFVPNGDAELKTEINNHMESLNAEWSDTLRAYEKAANDSASNPKRLEMMSTLKALAEENRAEISAQGFKME